MLLFDDLDNPVNLLPHDGFVIYQQHFLDATVADIYFHILMDTIEWKNDEAFIFGKHFITKRKVAWYGDNHFSYTYSRATKQALPWTKELLRLKQLVEAATSTVFNSCLLNLYHNGDEGMAWHSDDEKTLQKDGAIASVSLGTPRRFLFKHRKTKESIGLELATGSLLIMKGETQTNWLHCLPKSKRVALPRINLTFRTMLQ